MALQFGWKGENLLKFQTIGLEQTLYTSFFEVWIKRRDARTWLLRTFFEVLEKDSYVMVESSPCILHSKCRSETLKEYPSQRTIILRIHFVESRV